jgi:hypothetical protein
MRPIRARARNGEPYGELGLVTQKDKGLWQDQTGGPSDPQPGNIPGGSRDVLRSADFNDASLQTFAVDSGAWAVSGGVLTVAAESKGQDAAAVWYHDQYLPIYFEVTARINLTKPTAGWKGNGYVIFDYFSPTDFKFVGLDDATNKLVMGYRDVGGWRTVTQASIPGGVKYDTWYDILVAVNGTTVMVTLNGRNYFTYSFGPRMIDGEAYGLNKGLLGFGSDNSRGMFDNVQLRVLPPNLTLDRTEDFAGGVAPQWLAPTTGSWAVTGSGATGAYNGTSVDGLALSLFEFGAPIAYDAYLELDAVVKAGTPRAGIVFDYYSDTDFKYLMVNTATGLIQLGHRTATGWAVDTFVTRTLTGSTTIKLTIKGASVNVVVNGQTLFGYGYNSALVDGRFGVLTDGTATFDDVRVRSNASNFDDFNPTAPRLSISDASVTEGNSGTTNVSLVVSLDAAATEQVTVQWATGPGSALGDLDYVVAAGSVTFAIGETTKTITVQVIGDTLVEGNEIFYVTLSNASGAAVISDGLGVVTINDDDVAATVPTVTVTATNGAEGGSPVVFTLTRTGSTSGTLAVSVITGGTTAAGDVGTPVITGGTWSGSVVTFAAGSSTITITYPVVDDSLVEPTETLTLTLASGSGYTVGSPSTATANITDNDVAQALSTVTIGATSGAEGGAPVVITLTRTGATTDQLAVSVAIGGTASASDLGVPVVVGGSWNGTNTVTFAVGSSTVALTFAVVDDSLVEDLETFTMTLVAGSLYTLGSPSSAGAAISDNDTAPPPPPPPPPPPSFAINSVTVTESDNGKATVYANLIVTRSGDTSGSSTVTWTTVAGSALAGSDFQAASGTLTFAAGETSKTIRITIAADKKAEPTETFSVVLKNSTGTTIAAGTVTIVDNDGALFAASAGPSISVEPLRHEDAAAILAVAVQRWLAAGASPNALAGITILIADLPGRKLADTLGTTITIDADAAGWGWSLAPGVPSPGRMDLLSVLLHEVGHVLGFEHSESGLMAGEIEAGTQLWLEFQAALDALPAVPLVAIQVAVSVDSVLGGLEHAATLVEPLADATANRIDAVDRTAGSILKVADPAVRAWAASVDVRSMPLTGATTRPWNEPLLPSLAVALGMLMLVRRRRVV